MVDLSSSSSSLSSRSFSISRALVGLEVGAFAKTGSEDELLEELEQMELEGVTDQLTRLDTGTSTTAGSSSDPVFANAPTSKPTSAREIEKEREERELLEELKSTMTMKVEAPMS